MDVANHVILVGAALMTLAIFSGVLFSRIGAPLLLVFLGLGMLAGEDGPGGIHFNDFGIAYFLGSLALAVILFDGGLRTSRATLALAWSSAGLMATLGVLITAGVTGIAAHLALGFDIEESLLLGAIVGSTDAAAVFFLLSMKGLRLIPKVGATLEAESGLNDPMAIFLTMLLMTISVAGAPHLDALVIADFGLVFVWQLLGGLLFGLIGGVVILRLINVLDLVPALYPILAGALALVVFAVAQVAGASGFLAIYLVGFTLANNAHRAKLDLARFSDGVAWIAQIAMFLMMGLLVTPTELLQVLWGSLAVAATLILVARPLATFLCLTPLKFSVREMSFISWVGLRGAVPIFLGTLPVLAGAENAEMIFSAAFTVVLTSLVIQGWSIGWAAKLTKVELPPRPKAAPRAELDLPAGKGRNVVAYTVHPLSLVAQRPMRRLPLPAESELITVMRNGENVPTANALPLEAGDMVFVVSNAEHFETLDRLFGARPQRKAAASGLAHPSISFTLDPSARLGDIAQHYALTVPSRHVDTSLGDYVAQRRRKPAAGDVVRLGDVGFVVLEATSGKVQRLAIDLSHHGDPGMVSRFLKPFWEPLRSMVRGT